MEIVLKSIYLWMFSDHRTSQAHVIFWQVAHASAEKSESRVCHLGKETFEFTCAANVFICSGLHTCATCENN